MSELASKNKKNLEDLVKEFTDKTLFCDKDRQSVDQRHEDAKRMCFTICYPLSIHLKNNGFDNSIIRGNYKDFSEIHFWLMLEDNETIVDPTIEQINKGEKAVIIKKGCKYYEKYEAKKNLSENNNNAAFIEPKMRWLAPFGVFISCGKDIKPAIIDKPRCLRINLNAAIILDKEINKISLKDPFILEYFCYINEIIKANEPQIRQWSEFDILFQNSKNTNIANH